MPMTAVAPLRKVMTVTPDEWRLVWALREVPEGTLREELLALLEELVAMSADPHCAEMQADGVPCASVGVACDQCQRAASRLRMLLGLVRPV